VKAWLLRIGHILAWDDTRPSRLFIGLLDLVFALYLTSAVSQDDMAVMSKSLQGGDATPAWIVLFVLHGLLILRGLTGKYGFLTMMGEGVLGVFIWGITALTHTMAQGIPGPTSVCLAIALWICARHPLDFQKTEDRRRG
jgi:hypothetical protein